jgi:Fe-S-cluster containining protein
MKRLSKLSKECIKNRGLCCEDRLNVVLEDEEQRKLMFGKDKTVVDRCRFFKEPFCTIYEKRPVDCKAYPITIEKINNKYVFLIDLKCPAVKKGLVDKRFINSSIRLWKSNWPTKKWLIENSKDNKNKKMYKWITIDEYLRYRNKLKK